MQIAGVLLARITDHDLKSDIIKTLQSVWFDGASKGKDESEHADNRVMEITSVLMSQSHSHQRAHFNTLLDSVGCMVFCVLSVIQSDRYVFVYFKQYLEIMISGSVHNHITFNADAAVM